VYLSVINFFTYLTLTNHFSLSDFSLSKWEIIAWILLALSLSTYLSTLGFSRSKEKQEIAAFKAEKEQKAEIPSTAPVSEKTSPSTVDAKASVSEHQPSAKPPVKKIQKALVSRS
jgi:Ca2+/Na+ antiporter